MIPNLAHKQNTIRLISVIWTTWYITLCFIYYTADTRWNPTLCQNLFKCYFIKKNYTFIKINLQLSPVFLTMLNLHEIVSSNTE